MATFDVVDLSALEILDSGLYTILVEGDDMTEPIADAARGILDGHIILSRKLAHKSHYPAIDVLDSVSRVAPPTMTPAAVISRPAPHQLRSVTSDFAAPTRKCATSDTITIRLTLSACWICKSSRRSPKRAAPC